MMSALMSDIIEERIDAKAANAVCRAGGTLLRIVELQQKYGTPSGQGADKVLSLAPSVVDAMSIQGSPQAARVRQPKRLEREAV